MSINFKLHQTHSRIADFDTHTEYIKEICKNSNQLAGTSIHLLPELYLAGYPLKDLCLDINFIERHQQSLESLDKFAKNLPENGANKFCVLFGALSYDLKGNVPNCIKNSLYQLTPGHGVTRVYDKKLLPSYDIFDEEKYFTPGREAKILEVFGLKLGILICEDMWSSNVHATNPAEELFELHRSRPIDLLLNFSGSPYHLGKRQKREERVKELSNLFDCPFLYVNRVGGEDEILFDGHSLIAKDDELLKLKNFCEDTYLFNFEKKAAKKKPIGSVSKLSKENTWESLFDGRLISGSDRLELKKLTSEELEETTNALIFGLNEYAGKNHFKKYTVALSGGLDSALTLALAKLSLKSDQSIEAVYMPGLFSKPESYEWSKEMCEKLEIPFYNLPIKFLHTNMRRTFKDTFKKEMSGLADENIQSRLRGSLIYARSNASNSMVINTSNKSEIAVGYSTLYGDSVGALSLIGDLYKTEVVQLAKFINQKYQGMIPEEIINRAPSAELRENQKDTDSLPPYPILDAILEAFLSYRYKVQDLLDHGHSLEDIKIALGLYQRSEYKRKQFCPILKIKGKSFGQGHRIPLSKSSYIHFL